MRLTELALQRAGAADLEEFQRREGLYPSGQEDILTMQRLTPLSSRVCARTRIPMLRR